MGRQLQQNVGIAADGCVAACYTIVRMLALSTSAANATCPSCLLRLQWYKAEDVLCGEEIAYTLFTLAQVRPEMHAQWLPASSLGKNASSSTE
jgi:hypothetical protein